MKTFLLNRLPLVLILTVCFNPLAKAQSICAGAFHNLYLSTAHNAYGWGVTLDGELGSTYISNQMETSPVPILNLSNISSIAAGYSHSFYVMNDGTVWASGGNFNSELADSLNTYIYDPYLIPSINNVSVVASSTDHTFFLKNDGTVWACGFAGGGQCGTGTTVSIIYHHPVQVLISNVTQVAAGETHTLFLESDGSVWACGFNTNGAVGTGGTQNVYTPVQIMAPGTCMGVAAGNDFSLILKGDGTVLSCGANPDGELGNGSTNNSLSPTPVLGVTGIAKIAAGSFHSLFLTTSGTVWACGSNIYGQLGLSSTFQNVLTPVLNTTLSSVIAVSGGRLHSLFLLAGGNVWSAGRNTSGQLGNGTTNDSNAPLAVNNIWNSISLTLNSVEPSFQISPNPVTSNCKMTSSVELQDATLIIYNVLGELVSQHFHFNGSEAEVITQNLPSGAFIFQLMNQNEVSEIKVVKN